MCAVRVYDMNETLLATAGERAREICRVEHASNAVPLARAAAAVALERASRTGQ